MHNETEPQPTATEAPPRVMTLIYVADRYSNKIETITLVDSQQVADALTALIERTGAKAEVVDVPIWPNMKKVEA